MPEGTVVRLDECPGRQICMARCVFDGRIRQVRRATCEKCQQPNAKGTAGHDDSLPCVSISVLLNFPFGSDDEVGAFDREEFVHKSKAGQRYQ